VKWKRCLAGWDSTPFGGDTAKVCIFSSNRLFSPAHPRLQMVCLPGPKRKAAPPRRLSPPPLSKLEVIFCRPPPWKQALFRPPALLPELFTIFFICAVFFFLSCWFFFFFCFLTLPLPRKYRRPRPGRKKGLPKIFRLPGPSPWGAPRARHPHLCPPEKSMVPKIPCRSLFIHRKKPEARRGSADAVFFFFEVVSPL